MHQCSFLDIQYFLLCVGSYIRGFCALSSQCDAGLIANGKGILSTHYYLLKPVLKLTESFIGRLRIYWRFLFRVNSRKLKSLKGCDFAKNVPESAAERVK